MNAAKQLVAMALLATGCSLIVSTSDLSGGPPKASSSSSGDAGSTLEAGIVEGGVVVDAGSTPTSCNALMSRSPIPPDGIYAIDPDGSGPAPAFQAYCDLTNDRGGWTLLLKVNGEVMNLPFDSEYWTDARTIAEDQPGLDSTTAKLAGYMSMPFEAVRVGVRVSGATAIRYLVLPAKAESLQKLFSGDELLTSAGRDAWLALFDAPVSQQNCNVEGFNIVRGSNKYAFARLGIIFNNETNCISPDSYIGLAGWEGTGNFANNSAGPQRDAKDMFYLEVR